MIELFNVLAIVEDMIGDEDHVVYLLASLPDSYSTQLVTALKDNEQILKMEIIIERILYEVRKDKEINNFDHSAEKSITTKQQFKRKPVHKHSDLSLLDLLSCS